MQKTRFVALVTGVIAAMAWPAAAHAEQCVSVPMPDEGPTLEVGGNEYGIPIVDIRLCVEGGGVTPGVPDVDFSSGNGCDELCVSVLVDGGSGASGYLDLYYSVDSEDHYVSVPLPGGGPTGERCVVGVGVPAPDNCEVRLSLTRSPIPGCIAGGRVCLSE